MSEEPKGGKFGGLLRLLGILTGLITAVATLISVMQPSPPPQPQTSPVATDTKVEVEVKVQNEFNKPLTPAMTTLLEQIEQVKQSQQNNGLYGVVKITWLDAPQVAVVLMDGSYGAMRTLYISQENTSEVVDLDLKLETIQDNLYLVSYNPTVAGTSTPVPAYVPDFFLVEQTPVSGQYQITAICDTKLACSRIQTESIY